MGARGATDGFERYLRNWLRRIEGKTTNADTCPDCSGTLRTVDGEQCCEDCGLIVEVCRLDRSGSRTFSDDEHTKERTGSPMTETRHDRGLSTTIGYNRDENGNTLSNEK